MKENEIPVEIKNIIKKIEEKIDETTETKKEAEEISGNTKANLAEIAKKLGLESEEFPDNIEEACHVISESFDKIKETLKSAMENNLCPDLSYCDDSLTTLCNVLFRELEAIKKAVEEKEQKTDQ